MADLYNRSTHNSRFGTFKYRDLEGGKIEVDPSWLKANMISYPLPLVIQKAFKTKSILIHKSSKPYWERAFSILVLKPELLALIQTFDGVYVARHVRWDPKRGISNHAWGTAIDLNASSYPLGTFIDASKTPQSANLILYEKVFKPAGFSWGNSYKDPMHFEIL